MRNVIWSRAADICQVRESFLVLWKIFVLLGAGAGLLAASGDYLTGKNVMDVRMPDGVLVKGIPRETDLGEVQALYAVHTLKERVADNQKAENTGPPIPSNALPAEKIIEPVIENECRRMRLESTCYQYPKVVFGWYPLVMASLVATFFPLIAELAFALGRVPPMPGYGHLGLKLFPPKKNLRLSP
ncbi:MAG TPA: hypothetical protein VIV27_02365 [Halioglobus sp.]